MPRKWSKAVPEGNGPVPQYEEFGSNQPILADLYRLFEEIFGRQLKMIDELVEMKATDQLQQTSSKLLGSHVLPWRHTCQQRRRLASARGAPLLQFKRNMGIAVLQKRVQAGSISSTSFGMKTEPPALPRRDDVLVYIGAAAPKSWSLTRGDAHANSRRWLTPHRQSLYNDENHLSAAASSVLPDREDEF